LATHREAPEISGDAVADGCDLYAFVSPGAPHTVTIIANYAPEVAFPEFAGDVLYEIHFDVNGDARPDLTYQFRFRTALRDAGTFFYNTGPISSLDDENWNRRQFYSVTSVDAYGKSSVLARSVPCPPCHAGTLTIADYPRLAAGAIANLPTGEVVFAGQRAAFGSANPRNVLSIAIQVPLDSVRREEGVLGIWTSSSRRRVSVSDGDHVVVGPFAQVSRLGNPLVREVFIPADRRELWNSLPPSDDKRFAVFIERPPHAFGDSPRADLVAMVLTGSGVNHTGEVQADMLRLNPAFPARFPNGRALTDDVTEHVLRAVAGAPGAAPPGAAPPGAAAGLLDSFPYLGTPYDGIGDPS
jgi:hypothetical protein